MVTKRRFSCGTNAGYPEEASWAPMPARVANQNAEDPTGGGGKGVGSSGTVHGPKKYVITNHGYQTFISAFESDK